MSWHDNEGLKDWSLDKIPELNQVDMAFLAHPFDWLPDWKSIASTKQEALDWQNSDWGKYVSRMFFQGVSAPTVIKEGVKEEDAKKAWMVVRAALGSYATSHEHKVSGCAWILSQFYELPTQ